MTPDLGTQIREAARSGRLRGVTLWPTADGRWQASTTEDRVGWQVEIDADPVAAMARALREPAASLTPPKPTDTGSIFD